MNKATKALNVFTVTCVVFVVGILMLPETPVDQRQLDFCVEVFVLNGIEQGIAPSDTRPGAIEICTKHPFLFGER